MILSHLFEQLLSLSETKVNPVRHFSQEEAVAVVDTIKDACRRHRIEIIDRDKNLEFIHEQHLSKETAIEVINRFIEPKNLIAVLQNRNKENSELYLFSIGVPLPNGSKRYIYMKCAIDSVGNVTVISFHKQNEKMHTDYRKAEDGDSYYLQKLGRTWMRLYNNYQNKPRIVSSHFDGDYLYFDFEKPVSEADVTVKANVIRSVPRDFGYRPIDIDRNITFESGRIKIFLKFGKF